MHFGSSSSSSSDKKKNKKKKKYIIAVLLIILYTYIYKEQFVDYKKNNREYHDPMYYLVNIKQRIG